MKHILAIFKIRESSLVDLFSLWDEYMSFSNRFQIVFLRLVLICYVTLWTLDTYDRLIIIVFFYYQ